MKRTYAREFQAAFTEALAGLGAREQTLLRYHHVDGLNIDEIGAIYRVHRVTAFRWLEKAKEKLVDATLVVARARLNVSARELESVLRLIRSQVHLSLVRHLGLGGDDVRRARRASELAEEPGPRDGRPAHRSSARSRAPRGPRRRAPVVACTPVSVRRSAPSGRPELAERERASSCRAARRPSGWRCGAPRAAGLAMRRASTRASEPDRP
ncbi:MAG: hypothetical protein HS111_17930 [Kofleriaceae bacterium]|nr:hypothetical protein [Kofleriaceae bacterium]